MNVNEELVNSIIENQTSQKLSYILEIQNKFYPLHNVLVSKSNTPLRKPASRGGVYHSDTYSFKINATIDDLSIESLLTNAMLGPNTEFEDLKINTKLQINNSLKNIVILANLTNRMQSGSKIQLTMMIIGTNVE